jgi:cytochrome P450
METVYDVLAPIHSSRPERDAALARLRREDSVHWDAKRGWWLLTRHAEVRDVSRQPELFSSEPRGPWHFAEIHFSMQAIDGKRHTSHRNIVSRAFTPRLVATMAGRAERYIDEAIDALADRRSGEFVTDLAVPVPMRIIAGDLGDRSRDPDRDGLRSLRRRNS